MKKIKVPHLGYTVIVQDVKKADKDDLEEMEGFPFFAKRIDQNTSAIYLDRRMVEGKFGIHESPSVAHEVVHVLQNIAMDRHMEFRIEKEHFAYLMNYIMNEIMGIEYDTR